jgi:hypothetical protein
MGRDVKVRLNYRADSTYLLRIAGSVEKDPRFNRDKKKDIMRSLRYVATEFMMIPSELEEEGT